MATGRGGRAGRVPRSQPGRGSRRRRGPGCGQIVPSSGARRRLPGMSTTGGLITSRRAM